MQTNVHFTSVKKGKTKNHLVFKGYFPYYDNNREYEFDYTGVEITCAVGSTIELRNLAYCMKKDYGHAPFVIKEAKKVFKEHHSYTIKQNEGEITYEE